MLRIRSLFLAGLCTLGLSPGLTSQEYLTIAYESFDYAAGPLQDMNGGLGWAVDWWSGDLGDHAMVTDPGFDGVGLKATTQIEHGGSYRTLDNAGFDPILDAGRFGLDGTEIWLSFECERDLFSDDWYGGISLYEQWVGEKLFVGSPWGGDEWGLDLPFVLFPGVVIGTNCSVKATLWMQVRFLPGDEEVNLWVDPATDYPTTTPDVQMFFPDFRFNEIRLQSGSGVTTGFHFDNISITTPNFRPVLAVSNLIGGQVADFNLSNFTPNSTAYLIYSPFGPGPTQTAYGTMDLTMPVTVLPQLTTDANGDALLQAPVPPSATGRTLWFQALDFAQPMFSNMVEQVVG